jgi:hypothetical protein
MIRPSNKRAKVRPIIPLLILVGGVVLVAAALVIGLGGLTQPEATPTVQLTNTSQVLRISVQDAKAAYDNGSAVFLDVRTAADYTELHITGALNIPLGEIEARMGELDPDDWIITY